VTFDKRIWLAQSGLLEDRRDQSSPTMFGHVLGGPALSNQEEQLARAFTRLASTPRTIHYADTPNKKL
jgi:hypothetical protein